MSSRAWLLGLTVGLGAALSLQGQKAHAEDWSRYYHWQGGDSTQFQWSPYQNEQTYDGYRYPKELRVYPSKMGYRNWLTARKPYYRGYHFILDRF